MVLTCGSTHTHGNLFKVRLAMANFATRPHPGIQRGLLNKTSNSITYLKNMHYHHQNSLQWMLLAHRVSAALGFPQKISHTYTTMPSFLLP